MIPSVEIILFYGKMLTKAIIDDNHKKNSECV